MNVLAPRVAAAAIAVLLVVVPAAFGRSDTGRSAAGPVADAARARCSKPAPRRVRRCLVMRRRAARASSRERLVAAAPVPPAPGTAAPGSPGGAPVGGGGDATPSLPRFVSVAAREWSLTLSRPVVGAGSVTIELRNVGEDPHNLVVSPDDGSHAELASWPETPPETTLRQSVPLAAGQYRLWCSLEGHEALGMSVRLRVE